MLYPPPRGLSSNAIACWICTAVAGVACVIALIVALAVQPADLNALACSLGSQSGCDQWQAANVVHLVAFAVCIIFALLAGASGVAALILTLNRR
jgi:hypothetical protein